MVFLIKRSQGEIKQLCLAMKKRGFGKNRWNGVGGKVDSFGESVESAARRETREEIGVLVKELFKVAELSFRFVHNPEWDQRVHVYFVENWECQPEESEEMAPKWFSTETIPFEKMWPDDIFWLPEVIRGNLLKARFQFGANDVVLEKEIRVVSQF